MLYAIIDIGSSSVRLAIYNIAYGRLELLMKKKHTLGLAGFIKHDQLQAAGVDKLCTILNEFRDFLNDFKIEQVTSFTTAAIRNVANQQEVLAKIEQQTSLKIRVISGAEEAHYDFTGIVHDIEAPTGVLIDVGGGSTEIVYYEAKQLKQKLSLPFGALLLYTKYVEDIFPSREEIDDMRAEILQYLQKAVNDGALDRDKLAHLPACGIGGTLKSGHLLYNTIFQQAKDNQQMQAVRLAEIINRYQRNESSQELDIVALLKNAPDRLKTIIPGLVIFDTICRFCKIDTLTYSDTGMREGFIYEQILPKTK